jgi:hypothetical protein
MAVATRTTFWYEGVCFERRITLAGIVTCFRNGFIIDEHYFEEARQARIRIIQIGPVAPPHTEDDELHYDRTHRRPYKKYNNG